MGLALFTEDLRDECMRRQDLDPGLRDSLKGLTFRLMLIGIDAPGGEDRALAINLQAGKFINVGVIRKPAPSEELRGAAFDKTRFDAKVIGDHMMMYDLVTGKMDLSTALGKVQIHGDITKLTVQAPGFIALLEFLATMDIDP
jgi:hypothetical protein